MTASSSSTLLLRPAGTGDIGLANVWPPSMVLRPGQRMLVLADLAGTDSEVARGAAVLREALGRWIVVAAAVDDRWPPAAVALVEQLRSHAAASGACELVFTASCAANVLAEVLLISRTQLDVGGAARLEL